MTKTVAGNEHTETHIDSSSNIFINSIDQLHVTSPIIRSNNTSQLLGYKKIISVQSVLCKQHVYIYSVARYAIVNLHSVFM